MSGNIVRRVTPDDVGYSVIDDGQGQARSYWEAGGLSARRFHVGCKKERGRFIRRVIDAVFRASLLVGVVFGMSPSTQFVNIDIYDEACVTESASLRTKVRKGMLSTKRQMARRCGSNPQHFHSRHWQKQLSVGVENLLQPLQNIDSLLLQPRKTHSRANTAVAPLKALRSEGLPCCMRPFMQI